MFAALIPSDVYLESVVGPAPKLHLTVLVIEREPGDVNFTGGHEDARWDVGAAPAARHHHIRGVRPIKCFAGAEIMITL